MMRREVAAGSSYMYMLRRGYLRDPGSGTRPWARPARRRPSS